MVEARRNRSTSATSSNCCLTRAEGEIAPNLRPHGKKKAQVRISGPELIFASQMGERGMIQIPVSSTGTVRGSESSCKPVRAHERYDQTRRFHPSYRPESSKDGEASDVRMQLSRLYQTSRIAQVGEASDLDR